MPYGSEWLKPWAGDSTSGLNSHKGPTGNKLKWCRNMWALCLHKHRQLFEKITAGQSNTHTTSVCCPDSNIPKDVKTSRRPKAQSLHMYSQRDENPPSTKHYLLHLTPQCSNTSQYSQLT